MSATTEVIRFLPTTPEAAWLRYLESTRGVEGEGYAQAEEAAWAQLQAALAHLPSQPAGAA